MNRNYLLQKSGFTLLELVVAMIIVGILATTAVRHWGIMKEKAILKEAISNLKRIKAIEMALRLESDDDRYVDCGWAPWPDDCDDVLGIELPSDNWSYLVVEFINPVTGNPRFRAIASRQGSGPYSSCAYRLTSDELVPSRWSGTCP